MKRLRLKTRNKQKNDGRNEGDVGRRSDEMVLELAGHARVGRGHRGHGGRVCDGRAWNWRTGRWLICRLTGYPHSTAAAGTKGDIIGHFGVTLWT